MNIILPWTVKPDSTNITPYPYLVTTKKGGSSHMLSYEEIIMRLEAAIEDNDWAAVELLVEDLRASAEDVEQWSEGWDEEN
jgi:hypothetical protein